MLREIWNIGAILALKKVWNYKILKCTVIKRLVFMLQHGSGENLFVSLFWVLKFRYKSIHF